MHRCAPARGVRNAVLALGEVLGSKMKKVLFISYGNIRRSPMAEFVDGDLVEKAGFPRSLKLPWLP